MMQLRTSVCLLSSAIRLVNCNKINFHRCNGTCACNKFNSIANIDVSRNITTGNTCLQVNSTGNTLKEVKIPEMPWTLPKVNNPIQGMPSISPSMNKSEPAHTGIVVKNQDLGIFEMISNLSRQGYNISLPRIVSCGNQSAGKTSLTEAITGIDNLFDKKTGMATKRPIAITLIKLTEGEDFIKIGNLGEKFYSVEKARQRIKEENDGEVTSKQLDISIHSKNIQRECIFIDLPGFIRITKTGEDPELPKKIRQIGEAYINNPDNIKMIVMSATEDAALSEGLRLVIKNNELNNSIGVFTKVDLVSGRQLVDLLKDKSFIPHLGVCGVKLRSDNDLKSGVTIEQMIKNEEKFIENYKSDKNIKLGMSTLINLISDEQMKRISHKFPQIKEEVLKSLNDKRYGHSVIKKLIETNDIHSISVELERIVTDMHPYSPMRIKLEKNISDKIKIYIKSFLNNKIPVDNYKFEKSKNSDNRMTLLMARSMFDHIGEPSATRPSVFGNNMMYGECNYDITIPELHNAKKDSMSKGLLIPFINILHPMESTSNSTKVQFVRNISKIVQQMTTGEFAQTLINIVMNEIKNFILDSDKDTHDIAKLFFVHIFDKISERANIDELKNSINQMILREQRPHANLDDIVFQVYKLTKESIGKSVIMKPGFFDVDKYPIDIELYSPVMEAAYIHSLRKKMSHDIFRMMAVNLLNPILTNTIELSLKTFKQKDFSKEEKEMNTVIGKMEEQINALDSIMKKNSNTE
jgi:hypothetical protein